MFSPNIGKIVIPKNLIMLQNVNLSIALTLTYITDIT